jgi:hypothetical protein
MKHLLGCYLVGVGFYLWFVLGLITLPYGLFLVLLALPLRRWPLVTTLFLVAIVLCFSQMLKDWLTISGFLFQFLFQLAAYSIARILFLPVLKLPFLLGKRLLMPRASEYRAIDRRPPVLLLRSFADDKKLVPVMSEFVRTTLGRHMPWDYVTFEEMLTHLFSPCGPVVAIGRPGEWVPPVGAAREWISNSDWQLHVKQLLQECKAVVMMVGRLKAGDGLSWELEQVIQSSILSKLVLIVPPVSEKEARVRWESYAALAGGKLPPFQGGELAAVFQPDGAASVYRGTGRRWLDEYRGALNVVTWEFQTLFTKPLRRLDRITYYLSFLLPIRNVGGWVNYADPLTVQLHNSWLIVNVALVAIVTVHLLRWSGALAFAWMTLACYVWGWLLIRYDQAKLHLGF